MTTTFREAAHKLWGEAGAVVHDAYAEHLHLFDNMPDEIPMVIGLAAYGKCIGQARLNDPALAGPRIFIASNHFANGRNAIADVVLHEMMHVSLGLRGVSPEHKNEPWHAECRRLAPLVLGHDLDLKRGAARKSVRVANPDHEPDNPDSPKTVVRKIPNPDVVPHADVVRFPWSFRPAEYDHGTPVPVPTY